MNKLIIANWKMFLSHAQSLSFLEDHLHELEDAMRQSSNCVVICPSFTVLPYSATLSTPLLFGAQDCGFEEAGAYTGDISARSLKELGCSYTLIGHSERRTYYCESDERIARKANLLQAQGITPVLCIGETAEDRCLRRSQSRLEAQLALCQGMNNLVIAYEPVWAIGTGQLPTKDELQNAVAWIRLATDARVLYGGSIDDQTCKQLSSIVDGFLVGRASIAIEPLKKIILSC